MKTRYELATLALLLAGSALAGPNAGGTLILHANPSLVYTSDTPHYCGLAALEDCRSANTFVKGPVQAVFHVLAAFDPASSPRLAGVTFGVEYTADVRMLGFGPCGDFELSTSDWPDSGEGTAITWNEAQTDHLVEVYWFVGYNYYDVQTEFRLATYPVGGPGLFADDSIPANLDPIAGYGILGFNVDGFLPCPGVAPSTGACCTSDGCEILTEDLCLAQGGEYIGDDTTCDSDPCVPVSIRTKTWGGVKAGHRTPPPPRVGSTR